MCSGDGRCARSQEKTQTAQGVAFLGRAVTRRAVPTALGPAALQKGSGCSTAAQLTEDLGSAPEPQVAMGGPGLAMGGPVRDSEGL